MSGRRTRVVPEDPYGRTCIARHLFRVRPTRLGVLRLLCLWYYVGEGGLDLAEGTDRIPGLSDYSGILLCAVTAQRTSASGADRFAPDLRVLLVKYVQTYAQPAARALAQVFWSERAGGRAAARQGRAQARGRLDTQADARPMARFCVVVTAASRARP